MSLYELNYLNEKSFLNAHREFLAFFNKNFLLHSCNSTAKPPSTVKILLLGGDWLQGSTLRHYVELLGSRPPDWLNHIRFFIVPIGLSGIARYLSSLDNSYATLFGGDNWQQLCSTNNETSQLKNDSLEITNRIQRYLHSSGPCTQIPIAEAMITRDEDSCQIFVPFITVSIIWKKWRSHSIHMQISMKMWFE